MQNLTFSNEFNFNGKIISFALNIILLQNVAFGNDSIFMEK